MSLRRVAVMLGLGAGLLVARAGARAVVPEPTLTVRALPGQSADEAILIEQGLAADWPHTDPVLRRRLVANLRFAGVQGTEPELLERAIGLGMHRSDPVVTGRILWRVRGLLSAVPEPTDAQLRLTLEAQPDRFRRPPVLHIEQSLLRDGEPIALPGLASQLKGTPAQLDARLGDGVGEQLIRLPRGEWAEVHGAYGTHRVRVSELRQGALPELSEVRAEVTQVWAEGQASVEFERRMAELRRRYRVLP